MQKLNLIENPIEKPADDSFDLTKLRLSQTFAETVGVKKLLRTIPVRKPNSQDFIRVHPDPDYRGNFAIVDLHDEREIYLVTPSMAPELMGECVEATLFTMINRQGVVRIWPVRLPGPDGKVLEWHRSAAEAAELAMTRWIRVKANMDLGAYEMFAAESTIQEPTWPDLPFQELLKIAFRERFINSPDHPIIKRLRGLT
jgi:hypothetical protein